MQLDWSPEAARSWAGYITLYGQAFGPDAGKREERRWYGEMATRNPAALEHLLVSEAKAAIAASLATLEYRAKQAAWYERQRKIGRNALKTRLREDKGADATTGRNYRIWRRYQAGNVTYAALGKEFGISGGRVAMIVARQRDIAPLRQEIWLAGRRNLGRPLDIDLGQEDYRGKWLYDEC